INMRLIHFCISTLMLIGLVSSKDTGRQFVTAFLENLAYYYPSPPNNQLIITAIQPQTQVNVTTANGSFSDTYVLTAYETKAVALPPSVELQRSTVSFRTVYVSSDQDVAVLSVSSKASSTGTSVVYPVERLGRKYHIAAPPNTNSLMPFQFVIVNTGENNTVTVSQGANTMTWNLEPFQNLHLYNVPWVTAVVMAYKPVAVLFGDSCANVSMCNCSIVFEQLPSVNNWGTNFIVPTLPDVSGADSFLLLETSQADQRILSSFPVSSGQTALSAYPSVDPYILSPVPMSAVILGPGLLMNLLPKENWAANFLLNPVVGFSNYALLVAKTTDTDKVMVGANPANVQWTQVMQTEFSQANVLLGQQPGQQIIWHPTSTIAVYHFGVGSSSVPSFGTPAIAVKDIPGIPFCYAKSINDYRKWTDALQYCESSGGELLSISSLEMESWVKTKIINSGRTDSMWIGLRQSTSSGDWYWLNKDPMYFSRWVNGEPGNNFYRMCATMSLVQQNQFEWRSDNCCTPQAFICYFWGTQF
ncbi:IgGFc-binding protein-like isoform X2, partial [Arapaima gigas]